MRSHLAKKVFKWTFPFVLLYIIIAITMQFEVIAEYFYARVLSRGLSFVFQKINSIFPFSVSEVLIVCGVLAIIVYLIYRIFSKKDITIITFQKFIKVFVVIIFTVTLLYCSMGTALYNRKSVASGLGLDTSIKVTDELMRDSALFYLKELLDAEAQLKRGDDGYIISPYTFSEVNDIINKEYTRQLGKNKYFSPNNVKVKPIILSEPMLLTGIIGVYLAPFGEASVNTKVVSFDLPVTMAHEMAHSKGVVRENEANFTAYYLCLRSDDAYLRYSGAMMAWLDCYSTIQNKEIRKEVFAQIPQRVLDEYNQSYEYYDSYRGVVNAISSFFNNLNLISSGVPEGVASYGLTQQFLGALYNDMNEKI